jgi:hypothetical protein
MILSRKVADDVPKKKKSIQEKWKSTQMTLHAREYYENTFLPRYKAKLK